LLVWHWIIVGWLFYCWLPLIFWKPQLKFDVGFVLFGVLWTWWFEPLKVGCLKKKNCCDCCFEIWKNFYLLILILFLFFQFVLRNHRLWKNMVVYNVFVCFFVFVGLNWKFYFWFIVCENFESGLKEGDLFLVIFFCFVVGCIYLWLFLMFVEWSIFVL